MKIVSKVDGYGRMKHSVVGKPEIVKLSEQTKNNIQLIKKERNLPVFIDLKV